MCPNTKSLAMHKGVCEGALISQTRDMCKKTELLPGVLVSHSPLGSQGLAKIDDNWLGEARLVCPLVLPVAARRHDKQAAASGWWIRHAAPEAASCCEMLCSW